jgi:hypothetical protein
MNITDVIIDNYYKVDSIGKHRILATKRRGISTGAKKYLDIYTILNKITGLQCQCHEAVKGDFGGFICGQDVTKWFGTQLVYIVYGNKQSEIPKRFWNLINPSLEGEII